MVGIAFGMSLMITALVRSSATMSPRLREELLHRDNDVFRVRIAQETCNRDFFHRHCFGFDLRATRFGFFASMSRP